MTEVKEIKMKFNLKEYRERNKPIQRSCLFEVECKELPRFAYLAKSVEIRPGRGLILTVLEEEGLTTYAMLQELKEKRYDLHVKFFTKEGDLSGTIKFSPLDVEMTTTLDWEDSDRGGIVYWEVNVTG